jgi:hypothetical protein
MFKRLLVSRYLVYIFVLPLFVSAAVVSYLAHLPQDLQGIILKHVSIPYNLYFFCYILLVIANLIAFICHPYLTKYEPYDRLIDLLQKYKEHILVALFASFSIPLLRSFLDLHDLIVTPIVVSLAIFLYQFLFIDYAEDRKKAKLAKKVGLFSYIPNTKNIEQDECNIYIKEQIETSINISIACSSGFHTFSGEDSPLHHGLKKCQNIRIIIACPFSPKIEERAENLGMKSLEIRNHICQSIKYLESLHSNGQCNVQLRFHQSLPFWRIIIIDGLSFIQQYPKTERIFTAPFFAFVHEKTSENGFYRLTGPLFEKIWDNPNNGKYDFKSKQIVFEKNNGEKHHFVHSIICSEINSVPQLN